METQKETTQDNLLESEPVAPKVDPYTTTYSEKKTFTDPTTGQSIMLNTGEPIDPTMINEGETIVPDPVIIRKDLVQKTKEMLMRRFSRKNTIVTGPMGLMTPTPVAYAGAFGITDGATGDQVIQQGAEQGFVPLDTIQKNSDELIETIVFESQEV